MRTAGLCALPCVSAAEGGGARAAVRIMLRRVLAPPKNHRVRSFRQLNAGVVLMGEAGVSAAAGRVLAALGEAGRSEGTIRRYQAVLDRFAAFLAGRGLSTASDQVCVDFIAGHTGTRLEALRAPVADRDVNMVRRPVVLMADALAGRAVIID